MYDLDGLGVQNTGNPVSVSDHWDEIIESIPVPTIDSIIKLQEAMVPIQDEMPNADHYFAPGMYARAFLLPKGSLLVGKIHKHAHFIMVLKGKALVMSKHGNAILEAGHISVSIPGVKRVGYALEDTLFVNVHLNESNTHDLDIIEKENIEYETPAITKMERGEL